MTKTGIRPPAPDAYKALCCICTCYYADGRYIDCEIQSCPFYIRFPRRLLTPDISWIFGKWSKKHESARRALGLTQKQYVDQYIIVDGKYKIGYTSMFRAKCFRCCAYFHDGRFDCEICDCPIYYWMPYRKLLPNLNWLFDLPYTRRHMEKARFERLTNDEYIQKYIAKPIVESKPIRVRVLA